MNGDEWIKELKPGDKVYVKTGGILNKDVLILTTVKRITPVRNVKTERGSLFRNGRHRIDSWNTEYLRQWTQELEDKLKARAHFNQLAHSINANDARTLTPEQVQKIYDIIKNESP